MIAAKSANAVCWMRNPHASSTPMPASVMARGARAAGSVQEQRNHTTPTVTGPISRLSGNARSASSIGEPTMSAITSPPQSAARIENTRDMPASGGDDGGEPAQHCERVQPRLARPKEHPAQPVDAEEQRWFVVPGVDVQPVADMRQPRRRRVARLVLIPLGFDERRGAQEQVERHRQDDRQVASHPCRDLGYRLLVLRIVESAHPACHDPHIVRKRRRLAPIAPPAPRHSAIP